MAEGDRTILLKNKTVIVTGAASGIGAETARLIKAQGGRVVALDCNLPADEVDEYIKVDLADRYSIDAALSKFEGKADALCNIAGVPPTLPPDLLLKVNVFGLRYFTEGMLDKLNDGASIVNLASMAGTGWRQNLTKVNAFLSLSSFDDIEDFCKDNDINPENSYLFSKECLLVWTITNWDRWSDRHIRMNAVSPGPVETPILNDFISMMGEKAEEDLARTERLATAADIAPVVAFLCSDGSRWIRGANIRVDGGLYASVTSDLVSGKGSAWK